MDKQRCHAKFFHGAKTKAFQIEVCVKLLLPSHNFSFESFVHVRIAQALRALAGRLRFHVYDMPARTRHRLSMELKRELLMLVLEESVGCPARCGSNLAHYASLLMLKVANLNDVKARVLLM